MEYSKKLTNGRTIKLKKSKILKLQVYKNCYKTYKIDQRLLIAKHTCQNSGNNNTNCRKTQCTTKLHRILLYYTTG